MSDNTRRLDILLALLLATVVAVAIWIDKNPEPPMRSVSAGSCR